MQNSIKELREQNNMSREELAYKANVSIVTVFNWEDKDNLKVLSYERLETLANIFHTSIEKILQVK